MNYNQQYYKDNEWYDIYGNKTVGIKRFLKYIDINRFKDLLINEYGRNANSSYEDMVSNAGRIAVSYVLQELTKNNKKLVYEISVVTGLVNNTCHCWIETANYYIDLTAKQFNSDYPDLMIVRKNKVKQESLFFPKKSYLAKDWLKYEESN